MASSFGSEPCDRSLSIDQSGRSQRCSLDALLGDVPTAKDGDSMPS
jgi:hypothetical protein